MSDDLKKGGKAIKRESDRKKAGRDRSDPTASDFNAGWNAGRDDRDPDSKTSAKDSRQRVKDEYGPRSKDEREAYKAGYAAGSAPK